MEDDLKNELHALRNNKYVGSCGESEGANKKRLAPIDDDEHDPSQINSGAPIAQPRSLPKQPGFRNAPSTTVSRMLDKKQVVSTTNASGIQSNALKSFAGNSTKASASTTAFPFKKA